MVDQHTPGGDEDRAGLSASSDDPMSRVHAHARTHEAALAWLAGYDPDDGKGGPIGETEGHEEFTRDVVLAAFEAGRAHKAEELAAPLSGAVRLLTEASQTFRTYEGHHQDQAAALLREGRDNVGAPEAWFEAQAGKVGDRLRKAGVNRDLAERIEAFLLTDTTPRDTLTGLALSLVQDIDELIGNSEGVAGLHMNGDVAPWSSLTEGGEFGSWLGSFDRLRDHLDTLFPANANPLKIMDTEGAHYEQTAAGDLVAFGSRPGGADEPVLTLVVNGTEYRTTSTSVRGKLGGCPIRAEWDGKTDLRVHIDTPGYAPPPALPIIYGSAGLGAVPVDEEQADPAATVRTIEDAVAGGLIPGIDEDRLSVARVEARLFPLGDIRNDTGGRATPTYGMDPEVVDALRQTHDGA